MTQENSKQERTWAMVCHLPALCLGFLAPLVVWLIKKDEFPLVDDQGKESLNFQLSMLLYFLGAWLLCFVLIGFPIFFGLVVFDYVMVIIAGARAYSGQRFRYPMVIRFIK